MLEAELKRIECRVHAATDWVTELVSVALRRFPKGEWDTIVRQEARRRGRVMRD